MKKLLSSKKNDLKNERSTWFKSDPPKRMVTSTWSIRNDSSNISSILQPEKYLHTPRTDKGVYKKHPLGDNTCYCFEKKIRPKLISRPRTCLSLDNLKKRLDLDTDLSRRPLKQSYTMQECCCKDVAEPHADSTDLTLLKRYRDELESKCSCLKYTESRKDYNTFRLERNEEQLKELEKCNELLELAKHAQGKEEEEEYRDEEDEHRDEEEEHRHDDEEEDYSVSTIMGTRLGTTTKTGSSTDIEDQLRTVQDVGAFRNEHYFDTHSTGKLGKEISRHTCVHQFRLDDRLLPEALNVDPYGRSRCSICSKPMEGDTMQLSKSYFSDVEKPSAVTLRNLAKCSELGLVPRSISIGGDKSKIELRVDPSEKDKLGMVVGKIRRPEYFNTFALRQQRMSC